MHRLDPTSTKATTFLNELAERELTQNSSTKDFNTPQNPYRHIKPRKFGNWIEDNKSLIVLLYMVAGMGFCTWATGYYLGISNPIWPTLALSAFVLGIYFLNWVAESRTDFINDSSRIGVVKHQGLYWTLAIGCFSMGVIFAISQNSMHWSILLIIAIGVLYSFPLLPWYRKKTGWYFSRIKDVSLLKSLTVTGCFTAYVFAFPLIFSNRTSPFTLDLIWLILGFGLLNFMSTVYDDILDYPGDKLNKVPTLPVLLGVQKCHYLLASICGLWMITVAVGYFLNSINTNQTVFLFAHTLFLPIWITTRKLVPRNRVLIDLLIESDLFLWPLGLLWLGHH
jgi:4-hydroxybenzoate polyprenyltransferase